MRLLLDTHAFLWWDEGTLPTKVVRRFRAASAWEVAIKAGLSKIAVKGSFPEAVADYAFRELPVGFAHAKLVRALPLILRNPFDHRLVAQAIVEGLTLVTRDELVTAYAVPSVWE